MLSKRLKTITKYIGLASLAGIGYGGYYLLNNHAKFVYQDERYELIKTLQSNSTVLALSNYQIGKHFGPDITSMVETDAFETFNKDNKTFSFKMKVKSGKLTNQMTPDFAEMLVNAFKSNKGWYVESIDIKFINSNSNIWHKLYDSLRLDDLDCSTSCINIDNILNSPNILDSKQYIKNFSKNQPFLLKSLDLLLNDKPKLNSLGTPFKLISHDVLLHDDQYFVKMIIEGNRKNAELLVESEKIDENKKNEWNINFICLMYEINEDNLLSSTELAKKYTDSFLNSIKLQKDYYNLLKEINFRKVLEDKIINNSRVINTIGRPFEISIDFRDNFNRLNPDKANVKINIKGKLNRAELVISIKKESDSWKLFNSDLKILWNAGQ